MRELSAGLYWVFIDGQGHRGPENNLIAYAPDADEHAVNAETRRPREAELATPRGLTTAASSQERAVADENDSRSRSGHQTGKNRRSHRKLRGTGGERGR